jgi:transposase-like protein
MENILTNSNDEVQIDNILVSGGEEGKGEKKRSTKKIPDETRSKVQNLINSGKTMREVAQILGISKSTVSTISKTPLAVSDKIPEILSNTKTEPMDDSTFISAIKGPSEQPALEMQEVKQPISKARQASILNKFMNMGEKSEGHSDDAKGKKGRKTVDDLLSKLSSSKAKKSVDFSDVITGTSTKDDFQDKSVYITKITMNVDNFPEVLKDHIKPDRDGYIAKICKMSISDLHQTLKLLETVRSSNNMANQLKYLLYGASSIIEAGTQRFLGMQTQGYTQMVRQQEAEIQSCLREIAINNVDRYKSIEKPEARLVTVLVTTLLATDSRNRMERVRSEFKAKTVDPDAEKKYEDL